VRSDAANAILNAVGYNLRLVLAWLRALSTQILAAVLRHCPIKHALNCSGQR
jgi:hypothetical protein